MRACLSLKGGGFLTLGYLSGGPVTRTTIAFWSLYCGSFFRGITRSPWHCCEDPDRTKTLEGKGLESRHGAVACLHEGACCSLTTSTCRRRPCGEGCVMAS